MLNLHIYMAVRSFGYESDPFSDLLDAHDLVSSARWDAGTLDGKAYLCRILRHLDNAIEREIS